MTMHLQLGAVSDYAYSDSSGKLFILGEFRYIRVPGVPAIQRRMFLTARIAGHKSEGHEHKLKMDLTDADGTSILSKPIEGLIRFEDVGPGDVAKIQAQVIIEVSSTEFPNWGDYAFHVFIDNQHVGDVPLTLVSPSGETVS